jgi:hypothetical protein
MNRGVHEKSTPWHWLCSLRGERVAKGNFVNVLCSHYYPPFAWFTPGREQQ